MGDHEQAGDVLGSASACDRVALAFGAPGLPIAEALAASSSVDCRLYETAGTAYDVWLRGEAPLPDVAFLAVEDPGLGPAAELLRARAELPMIVGIYAKKDLGPAVALLRAGFYDCLQAPLATSDALAVLRQCLEERRRFRAEKDLGSSTLEALTTLAGERQGLRAGAAVAELLTGPGPQAIVVAGRAFPGGEEYTPPAALWAALARSPRAPVEGDLPATFAGVSRAEAHLLGPGVLLLRAGIDTAAPRPEERLAGAVLALVFETQGLREHLTPPVKSTGVDPVLTAFLATARQVGHDINNPLCAITLNAQLLSLETAAGALGKAAERIRTIEENARKIEGLVRALSAARRAASESPVGA